MVVLLILGLGTWFLPSSSAQAAPTLEATGRVALPQTPAGELSWLLDLLMRLLGGNPEELSDPRLSLSTKLNIVRGQYETCGIPNQLSPLERQQLLDTILAAHVVLEDPLLLFEATEKAVLLFDDALRAMWDELGGEPGRLDF
jgi:hypothetical protein